MREEGRKWGLFKEMMMIWIWISDLWKLELGV